MYLISQYLTMATVQPVILAFCLNHLLKEEFSEITKEYTELMSSKIEYELASNDQGRNDLELHSNETEKCRLRHLEVCTLIRHFDNVSSRFHAILYTSSVPIIILLIFSVAGLGDAPHNQEKGLYSMTVVIYIVVLLSLTVSAANLATAVSKLFFVC